MGHAQKCITGTQTFPISKLGGWKHSTPLHSTNRPRRTDISRSNTFDNTGVLEIGRYLSTVEEDGYCVIAVALP